MNLNQEDGGNRHFILCTNNEGGICESITSKRIETVIKGKKVDGNKYIDNIKFEIAVCDLDEKTIINEKDYKKHLDEINDIKTDNQKKYDKIEYKIINNKFYIYGINEIKEGIKSNLKYYKTDFIEKTHENLDVELNRHTKELVQLENAVDIDDKTVLIAFDSDDLTAQLDSLENIKQVTKVYISRYVMLNVTQKRLLKNIPIEVIPDYYFRKELKEKGLNWR